MSLTIDSIFASAALDAKERRHLQFLDGSYATYGQTFERARRLASVFAGAGVAKGDRVMSLMGNCRALYEFFIATSLLGAIAVPINTQSTAYEVGRLIHDCEASACIAEDTRIAAISEQIAANLKCKIVVGAVAAGWLSYEDELARAKPIDGTRSVPSDPCLIIYSSGTTGEPKGIVLRHECLIENASRVIDRIKYTGSDVFLTLLPSFHLFGYSFDFMYSAMVRAPLVVVAAFDAEAALETVKRFGVTILTGVPTMFARMFDAKMLEGHDVSSVRLLDVGGGPVSPALKRHLRSIGIEAVESYGQTEISTVSAIQIPGVDCPDGSTGPVLRGFEVRVIDSEGTDVPVGEAGELVFRSPTFMHGYWNQPELTAKTIRGGWLHSGDIGRVDSSGNVFILDRVKDMIVANGFNVFPKEVENAICLHPSVLSVAVIGLPDELRGEDIHAFVVVRPGHTVDAAAIAQHCAQHLAKYKLPRTISFLDELPLTATGKIRRFKLREMAAADIAGGRAISSKASKQKSGGQAA
ncbi:class I adenylate-forming enzyme family protein [Bradyrhizobium cenepequi]